LSMILYEEIISSQPRYVLLRCPKFFVRFRLQNFDRCHSLCSLLPPPAAVASLPTSIPLHIKRNRSDEIFRRFLQLPCDYISCGAENQAKPGFSAPLPSIAAKDTLRWPPMPKSSPPDRFPTDAPIAPPVPVCCRWCLLLSTPHRVPYAD